MTVRYASVLASLAALALTTVPRGAAAQGPTVLRAATLAPAASPWGRVFKAWQAGVRKQSNDALEIQFFYGNQQGDEVAMVGKMRTRQLDGAAITATGLAQIYRNVLAVQLPGLFSDWSRLDVVRNAMRPTFDAEFDKQGFKILGWGDVGIAHVMSNGFQVKTPADLQHHNGFFLPGNPIEATFWQVVGNANPKELTVPEILPALTAGTINVVEAPALASEQLQWSSLLDNIDTMTTGYEIGALVFTSAKINSLPQDLKDILLTTGQNAAAALTSSIRHEDDVSFQRLQTRMTPYAPNAGEQAAWAAHSAEVRKRLRGSTFDPAIFDRVVCLAQGSCN
jgi:TRAP-type C4-dicarboxylate transport system substrate-binding protein